MLQLAVAVQAWEAASTITPPARSPSSRVMSPETSRPAVLESVAAFTPWERSRLIPKLSSQEIVPRQAVTISVLRDKAVEAGGAGRWIQNSENLERETGFEPATSTLARSHSTTELLPLSNSDYK